MGAVLAGALGMANHLMGNPLAHAFALQNHFLAQQNFLIQADTDAFRALGRMGLAHALALILALLVNAVVLMGDPLLVDCVRHLLHRALQQNPLGRMGLGANGVFNAALGRLAALRSATLQNLVLVDHLFQLLPPVGYLYNSSIPITSVYS